MALKFTCSQCGIEIITRCLRVGDEAECKDCGVRTPVPETAEEIPEGDSTLIGRSDPLHAGLKDSQTKTVLKGRGGWLILAMLVIAIGIIDSVDTYINIAGFKHYVSIMDEPVAPGTLDDHPLWSFFINYALFANVGLALACCYTFYLYFARKKLFPKMYILILVAKFSQALADIVGWHEILPEGPMFDSDTVIGLIIGICGMCIWIPYMLLSKRVKNTFLEETPDDEFGIEEDESWWGEDGLAKRQKRLWG